MVVRVIGIGRFGYWNFGGWPMIEGFVIGVELG